MNRVSTARVAGATVALLAVLLVGCGARDAPTGAPAAPPASTASTPAAGFPGIWPVTTRAEAAELQRAVDSGSQPWLLQPASVARAYAAGELGWTEPEVVDQRTAGRETTVRVREPSTGRSVTVTLVRAGRADATSIWVVTGVRRA